MLLLIAAAVFLTVFLAVYLLLGSLAPVADHQMSVRLRALDAAGGGQIDAMEAELAEPFVRRVLKPLTGGLAPILMRFTPQSTKKMAEEWLAAAGGFGGLSASQFLAVCGLLAAGVAAGTGTAAHLAGLPGNKVVGYALFAFTGGLIFPFLLLKSRADTRRRDMQADLPDVLDLLTVSVEAGLGFDGALAKLVEKMKGALVEEFNRALQEIRVGVPRREALRQLGVRCNVQDVSLFVTAVVQADQLGVSIGNVLRIQSAAMREKRRQRAQERAMKAPIKMIVPLVLFIFPTIFIVLLGPALIQIMDSFLLK